MGYTHYWRKKGNNPTEQEWAVIKTGAKRVIREHRSILSLEYNKEKKAPAVNDAHIMFNGRGVMGHETFILERVAKSFEFCKTARKPYDAAVIAVLRMVQTVCPDWLELSSDGDGEEDYITPDNPDGLVFPPSMPTTPVEEEDMYRCGNCEHTGPYSTFPPARDIVVRMLYGDTYTDVECPKCGSLAHPVVAEVPVEVPPESIIPGVAENAALLAIVQAAVNSEYANDEELRGILDDIRNTALEALKA